MQFSIVAVTTLIDDTHFRRLLKDGYIDFMFLASPFTKSLYPLLKNI